MWSFSVLSTWLYVMKRLCKYTRVQLLEPFPISYFIRRKVSLLLPDFTGLIGIIVGNAEKLKRRRKVPLFKVRLVLSLGDIGSYCPVRIFCKMYETRLQAQLWNIWNVSLALAFWLSIPGSCAFGLPIMVVGVITNIPWDPILCPPDEFNGHCSI